MLLIDLFEKLPRIELTIDLPTQMLSLPNHETGSFPIDNFSKTCLLKATDELVYLLSFVSQIAQYELAQAQKMEGSRVKTAQFLVVKKRGSQ